MPKLSKEESRKNALEKRDSIRDYIRNKRDPIVIKWKALGEQLHREEHSRVAFVRNRISTGNQSCLTAILAITSYEWGHIFTFDSLLFFLPSFYP